jgi:hypothetical protein
MLGRICALWLALGVVLGVAIGGSLVDWSLQRPPYQKHHTASEGQHNEPPVSNDRSAFFNIGAWADDNHAVIEALSTFGVFVFTVALVISTLLLWKAGEKQLALAADTAQRQLRAYVNPDSITLWDGATLTPPQMNRANLPGIVLLWRNTGETPAKNVVSWSRIAVISPRVEGRYNPPARLERHFSNVLGRGIPGNRSFWYRRALTPQQIADVGAGRLGIYVYGRLEYQDVFGKAHWTTYKYVYISSVFPPTGTGGGTFNICLTGNDAD